jgi:hypothetical protein
LGGQKRHNPGNFIRNAETRITRTLAAAKQASEGSHRRGQDPDILGIICHDGSNATTGNGYLTIEASIESAGNHILLPGGKGLGIEAVFTSVLVTFRGADFLDFSVSHLSNPPYMRKLEIRNSKSEIKPKLKEEKLKRGTGEKDRDFRKTDITAHLSNPP